MRTVFSPSMEGRLERFAIRKSAQYEQSPEEWMRMLVYGELMKDLSDRAEMALPGVTERARGKAAERARTRNPSCNAYALQCIDFWEFMRTMAPATLQKEIDEIIEFERSLLLAEACLAA